MARTRRDDRGPVGEHPDGGDEHHDGGERAAQQPLAEVGDRLVVDAGGQVVDRLLHLSRRVGLLEAVAEDRPAVHVAHRGGQLVAEVARLVDGGGATSSTTPAKRSTRPPPTMAAAATRRADEAALHGRRERGERHAHDHAHRDARDHVGRDRDDRPHRGRQRRRGREHQHRRRGGRRRAGWAAAAVRHPPRTRWLTLGTVRPDGRPRRGPWSGGRCGSRRERPSPSSAPSSG